MKEIKLIDYLGCKENEVFKIDNTIYKVKNMRMIMNNRCLFIFKGNYYLYNDNTLYIRFKGVTNFSTTVEEVLSIYLDNIDELINQIRLKELVEILKGVKE